MALKSLVISLATALMVSLVPQVSNAVPKIAQGAVCKSLNKKSTYQNKTFTCIKKNGKLVWSKGVSTKEASQAAENSNSGSTPIVQKPLEKLYTDIYKRYLNAEKVASSTFNFVRCPNIDRVMAKMTENAYIDAYSFWRTVYKTETKVNWLLMSEKDWDCWYEYTGVFEGPNSGSRMNKTWDKDTGIMGHCRVMLSSFCGYGTGIRENGIFAQYNLIGSSYKIAPTPMTVHHETVHIYQSQLMSENYKTSKINTMACWFIEGQANLFGMPIAFKGDPSSHRRFEISRLLAVYRDGMRFDKDGWLKVLNDLKTDTKYCFEKELGYSLGWLALEWNYLNYSIEEMHAFLESVAKGSTWSEAIQLHFKMDEQTYLGNIAQYLADEV